MFKPETMENVTKEIENLQSDVRDLIARTEGFRTDVERGLNTNATSTDSPKDRAESLFMYLGDAKHDLDHLRDDMKKILGYLEKLTDTVEYETVAEKARVK